MQLMCESHGLFMQVQSLDEYAARANPHALHQELVLCSRKYRAVLRAVYQHTAHLLQEYVALFYRLSLFTLTNLCSPALLMNSPALPHRREVKLMVETQRLAEQVWHLCEIFFLLPEMQAQPLLADWIQSHFPITGKKHFLFTADHFQLIIRFPQTMRMKQMKCYFNVFLEYRDLRRASATGTICFNLLCVDYQM